MEESFFQSRFVISKAFKLCYIILALSAVSLAAWEWYIKLHLNIIVYLKIINSYSLIAYSRPLYRL